jgi:hypothetical protein
MASHDLENRSISYAKDRSQSTLGVLTNILSKAELASLQNSKNAQQILDGCGLRRRKHISSIPSKGYANMTLG